jgi:hypothetical protein
MKYDQLKITVAYGCLFLLLDLLSGCGSSGGSGSPSSFSDIPRLDVVDAVVAEGDNGATQLSSKVTLSEVANDDVTVVWWQHPGVISGDLMNPGARCIPGAGWGLVGQPLRRTIEPWVGLQVSLILETTLTLPQVLRRTIAHFKSIITISLVTTGQYRGKYHG